MKYSVVFLLFSVFAFSQTHRFFYELEYKSDSTQTELKKRTMILDINPEETKYYDRVFLIKDSINKKFNSQNTNWTDQIPVIRKRNSNKNTNFEMIDFQAYSYVTEDVIDWKLSKETQKYQSFNLQKATANFGGRKWIAWFTKDLPFSEGPYKFTGLPGLVILLEDEKSNYKFSFIKNENLKETYDTSNFLEVRHRNKPIPVTEKIFNKKRMEYFNDPIQDIKTQLQNGSISSVDFNGVRYTKPEELRPIIEDEQDEMRKNNNPIELNKAPKYPKK
ncbi:MAG: GLPGLI family protein [Bergeyella sp.]